MDAPWPYVDAVHGKPEGPAAGALPPGLFALFVGEEVGADESGVLASEGGFVGGGAATRGSEDGSMRRLAPGELPVPPGGGPQQPQQRFNEAGDMVQHVFNS